MLDINSLSYLIDRLEYDKIKVSKPVRSQKSQDLLVSQDLEYQELSVRLKSLGQGEYAEAWEYEDDYWILITFSLYHPTNLSELDYLNRVNNFYAYIESEILGVRIATSLDLLANEVERTTMTIGKYNLTIPVMVARSFESYKSDEIFILDRLGRDTYLSYPEKLLVIRDSLFYNISNINSWYNLFEPLMLDIVKCMRYQIPITGGSFNVAIIRGIDTNQSRKTKYILRYFGFNYGREKLGTREVTITNRFRDFRACITTILNEMLYIENVNSSENIILDNTIGIVDIFNIKYLIFQNN